MRCFAWVACVVGLVSAPAWGQDARSAFQRADANGDLSLSGEEIGSLPENFRDLAVDRGGDGAVSWEEYLGAADAAQIPAPMRPVERSDLEQRARQELETRILFDAVHVRFGARRAEDVATGGRIVMRAFPWAHSSMGMMIEVTGRADGTARVTVSEAGEGVLLRGESDRASWAALRQAIEGIRREAQAHLERGMVRSDVICLGHGGIRVQVADGGRSLAFPAQDACAPDFETQAGQLIYAFAERHIPACQRVPGADERGAAFGNCALLGNAGERSLVLFRQLMDSDERVFDLSLRSADNDTTGLLAGHPPVRGREAIDRLLGAITPEPAREPDEPNFNFKRVRDAGKDRVVIEGEAQLAYLASLMNMTAFTWYAPMRQVWQETPNGWRLAEFRVGEFQEYKAPPQIDAYHRAYREATKRHLPTAIAGGLVDSVWADVDFDDYAGDFAAGDVNADGALSVREMCAMEDHHWGLAFDFNRDELVSEAEWFGVEDREAAGRGAQAAYLRRFAQADRNDDGRLSPTEWAAAEPGFRSHTIDTDGDGEISAAEGRASAVRRRGERPYTPLSRSFGMHYCSDEAFVANAAEGGEQ